MWLPNGAGEVRTQALPKTLGELRQRTSARLQSLDLLLSRPVEQLRGRSQRLRERIVVRVPPEVLELRRLPRDVLDVHAFVEPELRMRAADSRVLHTTPGALAGAV